jgi:HAD superfamily hydrolase (TIGR01549 family)
MSKRPSVILFDLDGTLLQWNADAFLDDYFRGISSYVTDHVEPKPFIRDLWASTQAMVASKEGHRTNQEVFEEDFIARLGIPKDAFWPAIERFYEEHFPRLSKHAIEQTTSREIIELAKKLGYRLVLATNPVFPKIAVLERLRWAGLTPEDFEWISTYEESHFCKPQSGYYQEILERLGVEPEDCVMVGNDMQEDMVAGKLGIHTYWVKDQAMNREEDSVYPVDAEGRLVELKDTIEAGRAPFDRN